MIFVRLSAPLSLSSSHASVYLDPLEKKNVTIPIECVYTFDAKRFAFYINFSPISFFLFPFLIRPNPLMTSSEDQCLFVPPHNLLIKKMEELLQHEVTCFLTDHGVELVEQAEVRYGNEMKIILFYFGFIFLTY